jgi:Dyp-type peroxidase family
MLAEEALELDDIQGHVLIGFGGGHQRLIGLRVTAERLGPARTALLPWIAKVTPAASLRDRRDERRSAAIAGMARPVDPSLKLAIALSASGMSAFEASVRPLDAMFASPAAMLASALRDEVRDDNSPVGWKVGHTEAATPHLLVILASDDEAVVELGATEILAALSGAFDVVYRDSGRRIKDDRGSDREHFGFEDGISQPGPRGVDDQGKPITPRLFDDAHPLADSYAAPGKPLVWPGQYMFGYASQRPEGDERGPVIDGGAARLKNGSLLVFRRLRQDVSAFRAAMTTLAAEFTANGIPIDAASAAAWCVGRWPDGTPLSLAPAGPQRPIADDPVSKNGFLFDDAIDAADLTVDGVAKRFAGAQADRTAANCPFFAHIRKVNPRDSITDLGGEGLTRRAQMLRRGVTYGPPWTAATDGEDRGLLFMAYMTSVQDQFIRLNQIWANSTRVPPPGQGIDPIIGAPLDGTRLLTRRKPDDVRQVVDAFLPGRWVKATGAGIFFAPGINLLQQIVGGPTA